MNALICARCNVRLEPKKTAFQYMNYEFYEELPCCPRCGQVYLDEQIVRGKMHQAEIEVEDK